MEFLHESVLLREAIDGLNIKENGIYADCTLGGGGHSLEIAKSLSKGRLIGIDRDGDAITAAKEKLKDYSRVFTAVRANYTELVSVFNELGIDKADGILFDLGVSSYQLDDAERGFSYRENAPLDMRMDRRQEKTAADIVNGYPEDEIARILYLYGEEKMSRRIASFIVRRREIKSIETTSELAEIIADAMPGAMRRDKHPAKRSFQALRIAVNDELSGIETALAAARKLLAPQGRLCVITFHSLEDRIVKTFIRESAQGCTCPKNFPICVCGKKPVMLEITGKPIIPSEEENERNPRAHSAKLRIAEKI